MVNHLRQERITAGGTRRVSKVFDEAGSVGATCTGVYKLLRPREEPGR